MSQAPFTTSMIRDERLFVGRWQEIQQLTDAMRRRMPAVAVGEHGSGTSSLLYHITAAAPVLFDLTAMPAHYIDVATFPDVATLRDTVARAFGCDAEQWLKMLPALPHPPLLAFDHVDAPHMQSDLESWWQELAPAIARGHLYCVAAMRQAPPSPPWQTVMLRPVNTAVLNDMIEVTLGDDAPRLSRADQEWIVRQSAGHMGRIVAILNVWYNNREDPRWREHIGATDECGVVPAVASEAGHAGVPRSQPVEHVESSTRADAQSDAIPATPSSASTSEMDLSWWWVVVVVAAVIGVVWWVRGG